MQALACNPPRDLKSLSRLPTDVYRSARSFLGELGVPHAVRQLEAGAELQGQLEDVNQRVVVVAHATDDVAPLQVRVAGNEAQDEVLREPAQNADALHHAFRLRGAALVLAFRERCVDGDDVLGVGDQVIDQVLQELALHVGLVVDHLVARLLLGRYAHRRCRALRRRSVGGVHRDGWGGGSTSNNRQDYHTREGPKVEMGWSRTVCIVRHLRPCQHVIYTLFHGQTHNNGWNCPSLCDAHLGSVVYRTNSK